MIGRKDVKKMHKIIFRFLSSVDFFANKTKFKKLFAVTKCKWVDDIFQFLLIMLQILCSEIFIVFIILDVIEWTTKNI